MTIGRATYEPGWKWSAHVGRWWGHRAATWSTWAWCSPAAPRPRWRMERSTTCAPARLFYIRPGLRPRQLVVGDAPSCRCTLWARSSTRANSCGRSDEGFEMGRLFAVRLPAAVVEALKLKEGDHIEIRITREREFEGGTTRGRIRRWSGCGSCGVPCPRDLCLTGKRPMPVRRHCMDDSTLCSGRRLRRAPFPPNFAKARVTQEGGKKRPLWKAAATNAGKTQEGGVNAAPTTAGVTQEGHDLSCPYKGKRGWRLSLSLIRVCWCSGHKPPLHSRGEKGGIGLRYAQCKKPPLHGCWLRKTRNFACGL